MKFGIFGPGKIAHSMAAAVTKLKEIECYAVGSRDLGRAQEFANQW